MAIALISCILIGYVVGCINPSYIISRIKGFDIRKKGSGNAGASNAVMVMGKAVGVASALFDIAKAYFAVWLAGWLFLEDLTFAREVAGTACIVGHILPFYMRFRGGKGLACLGGVILYYDWTVFLLMLAVEIVIVFVTDYLCFVPITASVAFPIIYAVRADAETRLIGTLIYLIATALMLVKHIENIRRIKNGTEAHFSFLWRKDKEMERLGLKDE